MAENLSSLGCCMSGSSTDSALFFFIVVLYIGVGIVDVNVWVNSITVMNLV